MKTYTATFSTGETFTRSSRHEYRFACGLIGPNGKVHSVTFSANQPKPDWWGTGVSGGGGYGLSNKERTEARKRDEKIKNLYRVEIVPC